MSGDYNSTHSAWAASSPVGCGESLEGARSVPVPDECAGLRLDQVLTRLLGDYSRSRIQHWIEQGQVRVNDGFSLARTRVWPGDRVSVLIPTQTLSMELIPQAMELEWIYRDQELGVLNKPAGLVVHPGNGNPDQTLQNGLLHDDPALQAVPRCGIVHRLDKDTSGLMIVARTLGAHAALVRQLQERTVRRCYWALVQGKVPRDGTVNAPVGRHPTQRTRMAVVPSGRHAVTHFRVLEQLPWHTLLECRLETGRTHQIRVHMAHLGYPLAADPVYGSRHPLLDQDSQRLLLEFKRQALHAFELALVHPCDGRALRFEIPLAQDMQRLLEGLRLVRQQF